MCSAFTRHCAQPCCRRGLDTAPREITCFPSLEAYRAALEAGGFQVMRILTFDRPMPLPAGMSGWLRTVGLSYLAAVRQAERAELIEEVSAALRPNLCDAEGKWHADYVRLRLVAVKVPGSPSRRSGHADDGPLMDPVGDGPRVSSWSRRS